MRGSFIVYGLFDPRTDTLRYVGKSASGMTRPKAHLFPSQLLRHNRRTAWIKSLAAENLAPEIVVLGEAANAESLPELEKLAIAHYREMGFDLVNGTDGGEGTLGRKLSPEAKAKISAAQKGRKRSPETLEKQRISAVARFAANPVTEEQLEKMRAGLQSRSPEERLAHSKSMSRATAASNRTRVWTVEARARLSEAKKASGQKPPVRTASCEG